MNFNRKSHELQKNCDLSIDLSWLSSNMICWYKLPNPDDIQTLYKKAYVHSIEFDKKKAKIKLSETSGSQFLECKGSQNLLIETDTRNLFPAMPVYVPQGYEDMVKMNVINEAEILGNLCSRFNKNMFYTFIDDVLLYIYNKNAIHSLFSKNNELFYGKLMKKKSIFQLRDFPAHLYSLITNCFQKSLENKKNQVIIFNGDSGSGKSLNFNKGIEFLSSLNNEKLEDIDYSMTTSVYFDIFEERFHACDFILNLFGSARTKIHENSSRFTKHFQLILNRKKRKVEAGIIDCFFLEKTRTIRACNENCPYESNFKIFYVLIQDFPIEVLKILGLLDDQGKKLSFTEFDILKTKDPMSFYQEEETLHKTLLKYFKTLNFREEEILTIFKILASILLITQKTKAQNLDKLSELMEIEKGILKDFLGLLSENQIKFLCNEIYNKLFKSIIRKMNLILLKETRNNEISTLSDFKRNFQNKVNNNSLPNYLSINFIDLLGFEKNEDNNNGFYQLCNHYLNEKLQQFYIENLFKAEEVEFLMEGLLSESPQVDFKDNLSIIEVFEKKYNISSILKEIEQNINEKVENENLPKLFFEKLENLMINDNNDVIFINKKTESFVIFHSQQEIEYKFDDFKRFLIKDSETYQLFEDEILISSKNSLFSHFLSKKPKNGKTSVYFFDKLSDKFSNLMKNLSNYEKNYVKCLSLNPCNYNIEKEIFNSLHIAQQLKYFNIENLLKFKKQGFLIKKTYKQFYQDYSNLAKITINLKFKEQTVEYRKIVEFIIQTVIPDHYQKKKVLFGKNRIFLNTEANNALDNKLMSLFKQQNEKAILIQKNYHCFKFRSNLKMGMKGLRVLLKAVIKLQAKRKSNKQRDIFLKKKKAIGMLQAIEIKILKKKYFRRYYRKIKDISLKKKNVRFVDKNDWFYKKDLMIIEKKQRKSQKDELLKQSEFLNPSLKNTNLENPMKNVVNMCDSLLSLENEYDKPPTKFRNFSKKKSIKNTSREHSLKKERERQKTIKLKNHMLRRHSSKSSDYLNSNPGLVRFMSEAESECNENENSGKRRKCIAAKSFMDFENKSRNTFLEEYLEISTKKSFLPVDIREFPNSYDSAYNFEWLDKDFIRRVQENDFENCLMKMFQKKYSKIMVFQNKILEMPILDFPKKYHKTCKKAFKYILQYCGDRKTKFPIHQQLCKLFKIVLNGEHDSLRDEIYLQIYKQMNKNPNNDSLLNAQKLMALMASFISPSEKFYFIFLNFIWKNAKNQENSIFHYIFVRMKKTKEKGPRKFIPLSNEMASIEQNKMILIPIYFLSGEHILVPIESYTTINEILEEIVKKFKITQKKKFLGIFIFTKMRKTHEYFEEETILSDDVNLLDYLANCEHLKHENENFQLTFTLYLKIRFFFEIDEKDNDDITLYYIQMVHDFLKGRFLLSEEDVVYLASCKMTVDHGDFSAEKVRFLKINIEDYIPIDFIETHKPQNWIDRILINYLQMRTYSKVLGKKRFLDFLKKFKMFASHQFKIVYSSAKLGIAVKQGVLENIQEMSVQQSKILIITMKGILICEEKGVEIIRNIEYCNIKDIICNESNNEIVFEETERKHFIISGKIKEIENIIRFYQRKIFEKN